jgi:EAL domain-containing protein (putative c-di-GMP-specific phosphodiesterase class I)
MPDTKAASIGLVIYPVDGDTAEDILKKADSAVYAAKKAGRSSWRFYDPSLQQETYEAILLTNSLRRVLERGELSLHYQPQLLPDGQTMVGFEALLRWHSPEYGQVSPLRFIPLAEKNGLITPIGQWVLEETCRFVKRLSALGWDDLHVAVNISPKQLLAGNFVSRIRAIIEAAQVKPEQIVLEVTESVLIESLEQSVEKMQQLHDFGVALALDDFGTGYSSLTYLKSLPVDILKIDKSFIDKNCTDHDQRQLVASMIELGHALNLTIVAEGVETEPQLELLQQYGCDCIQGYIFSKPLPEPAALAFLEQKRKASPAPDRP